MAFSNTSSYAGPYTGNGVTTVFAFSFFAETTDDVAVLVDGVAISTSLYTVALTEGGGGSVTFGTAPIAAAEVIPILSPVFTQEVEFTQGAAFLAETVEDAFDRSAMKDVYLKSIADRALKVALGSAAPTVGTLVDGEVLIMDGTEITSILADDFAAPAAASAAAALVSQNAAAASASNADTSETNAALSETNAAASAAAAAISEATTTATANDIVADAAATAAAAAAAASADAIAAAAAAAGATWEPEGAWLTATAYTTAPRSAVRYDGSTYICLVAHTSGVFATDLAALKWELLAEAGVDGLGAGTVTSVGLAGGTTGLSAGGTTPVTSSGSFVLEGVLVMAHGGHGGTTAADARTNLGLAIGTDVQAYSANLAEYAAVNPTAAGLAILDDADASAQRTTLGLVIGTNVQAYSANLAEYAAVNPTAAGLAILDDADASAQRTTLGLAIGTNVQAYSANLDEFATVNPSAAALALLDDVDAAAMLATLGGLGITGSDLASNGYIEIALGTGLFIFWGSFTAAANTSTTFTFSTIDAALAPSTFSRVVVSGGPASAGDNPPHTTTCTTTGFTVYNAYGSSVTTYFVGVAI